MNTLEKTQIKPADRRTMRAAMLRAPGQVDLVSVSRPTPQPNEILVRVEGSGICASSIPVWQGRPWFDYPMPPGAPGHEAWGRIEETGTDVRDLRNGDRVAILSSHAYAEYDVCDAGSAVKLPSQLDDKPVPGEPLGCAMNIFRRSEVRKEHTVAIVGTGFLGILLTHLVSAMGAGVIAINRRELRLRFAQDMGAAHCLTLRDLNSVTAEVRRLTNGDLCDVVIECTGHALPLDLAAELTRERGRLVIGGYHQDGPRQVNMQLWNWRGLDVINAHERDPRAYVNGMEQAVNALASGFMDPTPLYTHFFSLDQLDRALEMTATRPDEFVKGLVIL